jgi:uncharacterized membrane protein
MVSALNNEAHAAIKQAIASAEQRTHAQIAVVVSKASDAYQSYVLLYGLIVGSIASLALWMLRLAYDFPLLLLIQIGSMAVISFVPQLRQLCIRFVPKRALHHRAAHRAYEEYMFLSRHISRETPFVLFYVSLAERYAHVLPSHNTRDKVPNDAWETVIRNFTGTVKQTSVQNACIQAIGQIADTLAPHFS